jgi:hypothetical protein
MKLHFSKANNDPEDPDRRRGPNRVGWLVRYVARENPPYEGALEALLSRAHAGGWEIVDGIRWKSIPKLQTRTTKIAGEQTTRITKHADEQHVAAACLQARERGCDVLAFTRDSDGNARTQQAIEAGLAQAESNSSDLQIIGGVAIQKLESWIIALAGKSRSEQLGRKRADEALEELGISKKHTEQFVEVISNADLAQIPDDATSLRAWLEKAKAVLDET